MARLKITRGEARRRVAESKTARQRWLCALHLLSHQELIPSYIEHGKWEELRTLRGFTVPGRLEEHDPALYELLTRELAQLERSGLYARVLEELADKDSDRLAAALRRGLDYRRKLTKAEGGSLSVQEAAGLLHLSEEKILHYVKGCKLVAWRDWLDESVPFRLPKWQFDRTGMLPGLVKVLQVFRSRDQWRVMGYFLGKRRSLGGKRPLDLLRAAEVGRVLRHAENYFEENLW